MAKRAQVPGTNQFISVPDDWGPEEVGAAVKRFQDFSAKNPDKVPASVPSGGDTEVLTTRRPDDSSPALPDPSEHDPWGTWIDKHVRSAVGATGRGLASTADFLKNVADPLINDARVMAKTFTGSEAPVPVESYTDQPVREALEKVAAPLPKGRGYEKTAEVSEMVGPAVLETLLTGSPKSGPVRATLKEAAKTVPGTVVENLVKTGARTARDVGGGVVGGTIGGGVGEMLGQGELGALLGSAALTPGLVAGSKLAANKAFTDDDSLETLNAIRRVNERGAGSGTGPVITPSMGLVGHKRMGLLEDVTGRGYLSGGPAQDTRRQQYEGMEAVAKDATDRLRGGPAGGQISKESIGVKTGDMAKKALAEIETKIDKMQSDLEQRVGSGTSVDPSAIEKGIKEILDANIDEEIKDQARFTLKKFQRNYPKPQNITVKTPATTKTILTPAGPQVVNIPAGTKTISTTAPGTDQPSYGAVKTHRSRLGRNMHKGQPMDKEVKAATYKGETEAMKETAKKQGVPEDEFDEIQSETERMSRQEEAIEPVLAPNLTERGRHEKLFSSSNKKSLDQLAPYAEHTPTELSETMADSLELRLRGESNAGLPAPQPDTFDPRRVETEWAGTDQAFKDAYSRGNPSIQNELDDLALIARKDAQRPTRTRPGAGGNTLGASIPFIGTGGAAGAGLGALATGGSIPSMLAGAVITPSVASALNYTLGKALTNPRFVESVINPRYLSPETALPQMLGGIPAHVGYQKQGEADEARRLEEQRKLDEILKNRR
jgi:hypothetical protein